MTETDLEGRLLAVAQAYQAALEAGRRPDRQSFLDGHPDLADGLAQYLDALDALHAVAAAPRQASGPLAGGSVLGDFRIVREIGRGGMGVVYEAVQLSLGRRVALKVLPTASGLDERRLHRFKNEAQSAAGLHHSNIVPVYAVGCERGVHFYAMQLIDGRTLAEVVRQLAEPPAGGRPAAETVLAGGETIAATSGSGGRGEHFRHVARLMRQAAEALEHAHQRGVVHRDIKPANLLLDRHGQVWVTDFGLALVGAGGDLTRTGDLLGTLRYASPEQAAGDRLLDHRTDLYSLGASFYEVLTHQPPFAAAGRAELLRHIADREPRPPRALARGLPAELETIVLKCLSKSPADRYASGRALADDLERFLTHRPIKARRPTLLDRVRKGFRRHPGAAGVAALLMVLCTAGLLVNQALLAREEARTREALGREQVRAEQAERRLRQNRQLVDVLIELSEDELDDRPPLRGVRKRLLRAVLAHAEDMNEPGDAEADQAALRDRVRQSLADLLAMQANELTLLLASPPVLDALNADDGQRERLQALTEKFAFGAMRSPKGRPRPAPAAANRQQQVEKGRARDRALAQVLRPEQRVRLRQISLQVRGSSSFLDPDVADALQLTSEQKRRVREIDGEARAFRPGRKPRGRNPHDGRGREAYDVRTRETYDRCVALLSTAQKAKWREMTGEPFTAALFPARQHPRREPRGGPGGR